MALKPYASFGCDQSLHQLRLPEMCLSSPILCSLYADYADFAL